MGDPVRRKMTYTPNYSRTGSVAAASVNSGTNTGDQSMAAGAGNMAFYASSVALGDLYYDASCGYGSDAVAGTISGYANKIGAASFVAPRDATFNKLMTKINTGVALGKARIGVYEETSATDPRPGLLIVQSAEITATATPTQYEETLAQSYQMRAGKRYWLAWHCNSNTIAVVTTIPSSGQNVFGRLSAAALNPRWLCRATYTFDALGLPSSFPTMTMINESSLPMVCFALDT